MFFLLWRQIFTHTVWNWDISSIFSHTILIILLFRYTHQSLLQQNTLTTWCYYRNGKDVPRFANFHCFSSKRSNCLLTKNFTFVSKNENLCLYFKNTIWLLSCFDVKMSSLPNELSTHHGTKNRLFPETGSSFLNGVKVEYLSCVFTHVELSDDCGNLPPLGKFVQKMNQTSLLKMQLINV